MKEETEPPQMAMAHCPLCGIRLMRGRVVRGGLHITADHLGKIEKARKGISIDLLIDIADYFDVSLDYLILGRKHKCDIIRENLTGIIHDLEALKSFLAFDLKKTDDSLSTFSSKKGENIRKNRPEFLTEPSDSGMLIIEIHRKEANLMSITATELKANLGKYLLLAASEDVFITRNGKTIAKLTSPYQNKLDILDELAGSVPATMTLEEAREERLSKV